MASVEAGQVSVWRIAKHTREFAADDINGGGAAAVGGRWALEQRRQACGLRGHFCFALRVGNLGAPGG